MLGSKRSFIIAAAFVLLAGTASTSRAATEGHCRNVHSVVLLQADPTPSCGSRIDLCAAGTLRGSLRGTSEFVGTDSQLTYDFHETGVVLLTGNNTIHTDDGDLFTKDAIVLSSVGAGDFAEIDTIVGGTGDYAHATGILTGSGTFANGRGEGLLVGTICTP